MNNDRQLWFVVVDTSLILKLQNLFLYVTPKLNSVSNSSHFQAASKEGEIEANPDKAISKEPPPSVEPLDGESAAEDDILESSQKPLSEELTPKECFHVSPQLRLSCQNFLIILGGWQ
jgi:hypothetical protein